MWMLLGLCGCTNTVNMWGCHNERSVQVHRFWLVQDAVMAVLGREEVAPRTSLSLSLSGTILDPICELQTIKGLKPGATLRLVEGKSLYKSLLQISQPHLFVLHLNRLCKCTTPNQKIFLLSSNLSGHILRQN